ncbi:MAG: ABC transporter permease subunit [Caldilineaceae bacterium]
MALLLLAGLQLIPGDVYEAADVDGAGKIRQFFYITLPLLRPTLAVALVFRTLDALACSIYFRLYWPKADSRWRASLTTNSYRIAPQGILRPVV